MSLLTIYAVFATLLLSHNFIREASLLIQEGSEIDEFTLYEQNFLPAADRRSSQTISSSSKPARDIDSIPKFPIKTHIVTYGSPRTATTLLFNMVAVGYFLYLIENDPETIADVELKYWIRPNGYKILREKETPVIVKTHLSLDNFLSDNVVVFSAAADRKEAAEMKTSLERAGHTVAYVQDMETLKEDGIAKLVDVYIEGYGLPTKHRANLNEYFSLWEVLRQCCGQQMSMKWRNDMMPKTFKNKGLKSHPTCGSYDIDMIERTFLEIELYSLIEKYPSVQPLNKPSLKDENLNGTYCSSYNYLVQSQGLSFWGMPGGRPVRSKLDGAIKEQYKLGISGLKPVAHHLIQNRTKPLKKALLEMWERPEEEKKSWLKAVLAAREGGKQYSDYGIETDVSADEDEDDDEDTEDSDDIVSADTAMSEDMQEYPRTVMRNDGERTGENDASPSKNPFKDTHAIFLISFGEEAAESTLVERCILSLRRRGAWDGYVILLTDAPPERYPKERYDNVIVMHPLDKHLNAADGKPLQFTEGNISLKSKRFKTFIIDYVSMDRRLDPVNLIYYLDIDILAGNSMHTLFSELERKYDVSQGKRDSVISKLYFFTPLSDEWPVQGGTFIVERQTSIHCLQLWRHEIDDMTVSGRGRDQDGLRNIYQRIQSGNEAECELVRMENENFISFPTPRTFKKLSRQTSYPSLIHISNSVFAKWIDEKQQTEYIHRVLQLSEEERQSGKYGKIVIQPKKTDMKR